MRKFCITRTLPKCRFVYILFRIDELDQSVTSIENFSDELFYEIFDYLDSYNIYEGFSNLNSRFQQLLNSSSLLFKINDKFPIENDIFMKNLKQIIRFNNRDTIFQQQQQSNFQQPPPPPQNPQQPKKIRQIIPINPNQICGITPSDIDK